MSAKPIQMFSGVDSVRAADAYRLAVEARRNAWPYVHVYPPPNAIDVNVIGTQVTQAQAAAAIEVLSYQVNSGKRFFMTGVVLGASVSFAPGAALFTVDRNSPVGVTNSQFMPEHGLVNVPVQLGSFALGPWKFSRVREFGPLDVIRVKATNVGLNAGSDLYVCGLFGYEVPTLDLLNTR
jgi:hypothetical protein